jgi:hypothetical protein
VATVASKNPTLADVARRLNPQGKVDKIVELMAATNQILDDAVFIEGNMEVGHKSTIRTGLPTATWRKLNYGVAQSKSTTAAVVDTCGMLEAYAEIDKDLAEFNGNTNDFRLSEERAFIEAMNQGVASTLFYGDTATNPERFLGLSARYAKLSTDKTKIGYNVIDGGGTGDDNTSIWVVCWGEETCHCFYPKGSVAGLQHRDLGEVTLLDAAGNPYQGFRSHYQWKVGLALRDWRFVVRIANVDVSDLATAGSGTDTAANVIRLLVKAVHRIPAPGMGRMAIYCNTDVSTALDIQAMNKTNAALTYNEIEGRPITRFRGAPIRQCDAILNTEAQITA